MPSEALWSARRINALGAGLRKARRYLEVGIADGHTIEHVTIAERVGVDPLPRFDLDRLPAGVTIHSVTSDEFFAGATDEFDVVFLDGLHTYTQTYRDLVNTLALSSNAAILIDDVVPSDEISAMPNLDEATAARHRLGHTSRPWHGDVFLTILAIEQAHPELEVRTIIGSGNEQALVWRTGEVSEQMDDAALAALAERAYSEVFANGVPPSFHPADEAAAIRAAVAGVRALGS